MRKALASRRVPRRIGGGDEVEDESTEQLVAETGTSADSEASSVVRKPSTKSRKPTVQRKSLGPSSLADDHDEDDDTSISSVVAPNKLSRIAIQRNASSRGGNDIPFRSLQDDAEDRPSYSASYLQELKQSTPSTPKDLSATGTDVEDDLAAPTQALDLASKFGSDLSRYGTSSAIPTEAEIQEKKARRARLAKEQDFISLSGGGDGELNELGNSDENDDDDNTTHDDRGRLILKPDEKTKYPETRLVREDEDIFEDFDEFTSDGRIALGRKAEVEAARKRKDDMRALIDSAEGADGSDAVLPAGEDAAANGQESDSDDSERERNAAFEAMQTRHGTYNSEPGGNDEIKRPRTPPRIAPLPAMDAVLGRLRKKVADMQLQRMEKEKEMRALVLEKQNIGQEEVRVQAALKETAERYAKLRAEKGLDQELSRQSGELAILPPTSANGGDAYNNGDGIYDSATRYGLGGAGLGVGARGLESMAGTPMSVGSDSSD